MKNSQKGLISAGVIAAVVLGLSMTGAPDKGLSGGGRPEGTAIQEAETSEPASEKQEDASEEVPEEAQEEEKVTETEVGMAAEEEAAAEETEEEATMVREQEEKLLVRISAEKVEIGDAVIEYDSADEAAFEEAVRDAFQEYYAEGQTITWDVSYGDDLVTEKVEAIAAEAAEQ